MKIYVKFEVHKYKMSKVEIEILELCYEISYDYRDINNKNTCSICKMNLLGDSDRIVKGKCGDLFHKRCVNSIMINGYAICPNDNISINIDNIIDTNNIILSESGANDIKFLNAKITRNK